MQTFGAEGADGLEVSCVGYAPVQGGRRIRRDASEARCGRGGLEDWIGAEGAARAAALALSRGGTATHGCVGHVKRRRMKQRQEAPHGKVAWPYEDTLEACKRRGVTVIAL
jgi:hypothetical protein